MNSLCQEFQDWLERLPRQELSPVFRQHLAGCDRCQQRFNNLDPIVSKLVAVEAPESLTEVVIQNLTRQAVETAQQNEHRLLTVKLSAIGLLCLPVVVVVNWFWATLGYYLLAVYVSPVVAQFYLVCFILLATGLAGLSYGLIPLLTGFLREQYSQEGAS